MFADKHTKEHGLYRAQFEHDSCGIGMLVQISGQKSHTLIKDALVVLERLSHRGGKGSDADVGDGAGILFQIPHEFLSSISKSMNVALPKEGSYGVAMLFASPEPERAQETLRHFANCITAEGCKLAWIRELPTNPQAIGTAAAELCPSLYQVLIKKTARIKKDALERTLYCIAKRAHREIRLAGKNRDPYFYLASCSSKTVVYKGMLLPEQVPLFYLDLLDERMSSAFALVHSRFSTNTFPSWERAQPGRCLIHNGEINTIQANAQWAHSREKQLKTEVFGEDLSRLFPLLDPEGSDSAMLDDYLNFFVNAGYSLPHAIAMAIPEPYEKAYGMPQDLAAFYEYHNCLLEPWDGPAALAFTDGELCGATLDRNGLRPARYLVTREGRVILASESGALAVPAEEVVANGCLEPGEMLLVDTQHKRLIHDKEIKENLAHAHPYVSWLQNGLKTLSQLEQENASTNRVHTIVELHKQIKAKGDEGLALMSKLKNLPMEVYLTDKNKAFTAQQKLQLFGLSREDLKLTLRGMAKTKEDPVGAMGTDIPLPILSEKPQVLYNYFMQLFAQVTNPPIDPLRESNVISTSMLLGSEGNLAKPDEHACVAIKLDTPVLVPAELEAIRQLKSTAFKSIVLPLVFSIQKGSMEAALQKLFVSAELALHCGYNILILSDEMVGSTFAPIPALLATSGLHHHLIDKGLRSSCALVVVAGDAWETHHLASLVGYGANAVYPHQAYAALESLVKSGSLALELPKVQHNYREAATKGIIKIMSKMGISTMRSYHGSQVFEALGISPEVINRYFCGTASRIGGLALPHIEAEVLTQHKAARAQDLDQADSGGNYRWKKDGEYHLFNPSTIACLQQACQEGDYERFKQFSSEMDNRSGHLKHIRSLLELRLLEKPLPLSLVESEESIIKRFKSGAMSYGSISAEAHECIARAMNQLGAKSNSGEGGEDETRYQPAQSTESSCSAIKQVASGRFGVTINYLTHAEEIQIKIAQGAKPGEGGHLPGKKVYPWIASCRFSSPGVELISPPPHHDIYSIEDLAQLIYDLKCANPQAKISVKLASEAGVGTVAVGVAKSLADVIVISGYDGGTGAAVRTSIRHAGLPWELGVAEVHQSLLLNGLRNRVAIETDGKLLTGRDIVIAALLGAEEFAFATSILVAMGCDMLRVCNLDTCPAGIATQNPLLRKNFKAKPEHIINLLYFLAREVREWMSRLGVTSLNDLVGRTELLYQTARCFSEKSATVDLSSLLYHPKTSDTADQRYCTQAQQHTLAQCFDEATLLPLCKDALIKDRRVYHELPISTQDRAVGSRVSGAIATLKGSQGLPDETIQLVFTGYAGQSFGAFTGKGISLHLKGEANDYFGKGLSGGILSVTSSAHLLEQQRQPIAVGNVALFGATGGEAYINGRAGERCCVRNSGAHVVVEGMGSHGCEYMTGGVVLSLGSVGCNFAAGMSGGVAYLRVSEEEAQPLCNLDKAALYAIDDTDLSLIQQLLTKHVRYTNSPLAIEVLKKTENMMQSFVKLVPHEYKKLMDAAVLKEEQETQVVSKTKAPPVKAKKRIAKEHVKGV